MRYKIAIIGAGIAGNTAAWLLQRDYDVTVFEAETRLGGHTRTSTIVRPSGSYNVDTGFIVYNELTYPLFCQLLHELGVETQVSDMSFGVCCQKSGLEYGTRNLAAIFAQRQRLFSPRFLNVWREFRRFSLTTATLAEQVPLTLTLGEYLSQQGYSTAFRDWFVVPMAAAIWSARAEAILNFPLATFLRFMHNHRMLQASGQPEWRTIKGGSRVYVDALYKRLRATVCSGVPVHSLRRQDNGVTLRTADGVAYHFDAVVFACHSTTALRLLADASLNERVILGAIRYQANLAILHGDSRVLPKRRAAWASWNYLVPADPSDRVAVTYDMNRLQKLNAAEPFLVTLNHEQGIDPRKIYERVQYEHPIFDVSAIQAQQRWAEISGQRSTYYAGAYWRFGFHEDGVWSAHRVVAQLKQRLRGQTHWPEVAHA